MSLIPMVLIWWLALSAFGLAVLPLTIRIFKHLPHAASAFARPLGLLLVGYLFWQGATFGLLSNRASSILGLLIVVATGAWLACWRESVDLPSFIQANRPQVIATEVLFTLAFLGWVVVRAFNPDISATEKPMELAFLNGVLRSEQFPPLDPWLSGYAISYYYFGYVIAGMLAMLTSTPAQFAFNLMIPSLFALTATGAYAVGTSLASGTTRQRIGQGAIAVTLVLFLANLQPILGTLNAHRMISPEVHQYFNVKDMPQPYESRRLFPDDHMWWFQATRIVGTPSAQPNGRAEDYTINEFPCFSFVLGDMHPHILALPFVFLAIGFALNLLRAPMPLSLTTLRRDPLTIGSVALLFGSLGFLNAWDMPTFLFVLASGFLVHRLLDTGALAQPVIREVVYGFIGALGVAIVAYLPFYLAFRSQASGLGLVIVHTQLRHFVLFWGPLYLLTATFLLYAFASSWRGGPADWTRSRPLWGGIVLLGAICFALEAPVIGLTLPLLVVALALGQRYLLAPTVFPAEPSPPVEAESAPPTPRPTRRRRAATEPIEIACGAYPLVWPREHLFALVLAFTGLLLIMGCELLFIRDLFGNRMNTVFKLFYQAWICLALAGAYALPYLFRSLRGNLPGTAWLAVVTLVLASTLLYPVGATLNTTGDFRRVATLDGLTFWARNRPGDAEAIRWLRDNARGAPVVVEAVGGSYQQQFGRVASMTGLPTLLGWPFHEQQWRGSFEEQGKRQPDVEAIYGCRRANNRCEPSGGNAAQLQAILDRYGVTYVYIGPSEREAYGQIDLARFNQTMDVAFRNNDVVIYRNRNQPT